MKNLIVYLTLIVSMSFTASAQSTSPRLTEDQKMELKAKMAAYKAELKLTPVQQPKFDEINLKFVETLATLKEDNGSRLSKYRKLKTVSDERNKKMKAMLTPDQYKIFKAHQGDLKNDLKSRRAQN